MKARLWVCGYALTLAVTGPVEALGQEDYYWLERAKLAASDAAWFDDLGWSVAISGDYAVAGAPAPAGYAGGFGSGFGYASVFRRDGATWVEEAKLTASDAVFDDGFGSSVAISGDTIVVGAVSQFNLGPRTGSAYVFRRDGTNWIEEAKLTPSDEDEYNYFARSVAIWGETIVVGDPSGFVGSAYVYRYDGANWVQEPKLTASDGSSGYSFGAFVAISGDTIVVSDPTYGAGYVFRPNGAAWVEEARLTPFGGPVAFNGETIVTGGSRGGYVFSYDGLNWSQEASLTIGGRRIGGSVAMSGDTIVVGAYWAAGNDPDVISGAAYIFRADGAAWVEEAKLTASDGTQFDHFGYSVAIDGETVVAGNYPDNNFEGSAYIFDYLTDCNGNGIPDNQDTAEGTSEDCNASDIPDECERCVLCSIEPPTAAEDPVFTGQPASCTSDADCQGESVCRNGICYHTYNRFLRFYADNAETPVAVRVKHVASGTTRFVSAPVDEEDLKPFRLIKVARADSSALVFTVWPSGPMNITGCFIAPGEEYEVQTLPRGCLDEEVNYSPALALPTAKYGDTQSVALASPPDGAVNITDVAGCVSAFGADLSVSILQYEIGWEEVEPRINITDAVEILNAFQGKDYPFSAPRDCP